MGGGDGKKDQEVPSEQSHKPKAGGSYIGPLSWKPSQGPGLESFSITLLSGCLTISGLRSSQDVV